MKLQGLRWFIVGWVIFVLTGCGGVSDNQVLTSLLVLTPLPTSYLEGDCENPSVLENWLQTLVFNQGEFTTFLESARSQSRPQLFARLQELNAVALVVANTPILSCGIEAYDLTITAMTTALAEMTAYVNAERQDLDIILRDAQTRFVQAQMAQNALINLLDSLYQNNASAP